MVPHTYNEASKQLYFFNRLFKLSQRGHLIYGDGVCKGQDLQHCFNPSLINWERSWGSDIIQEVWKIIKPNKNINIWHVSAPQSQINLSIDALEPCWQASSFDDNKMLSKEKTILSYGVANKKLRFPQKYLFLLHPKGAFEC